MRPLVLLLALAGGLAASGCDVYSEALTDDAPAVMASLDGSWLRTITQERISATGEVTPIGGPVVHGYDVAREVQCFRITLRNVSDRDRVTIAYDPSVPDPNAPDVARDCDIIGTDHDGLRIVFPGTISDVVGTIVERSRSRHVWHFYTALPGGEAEREIWTLTPLERPQGGATRASASATAPRRP